MVNPWVILAVVVAFVGNGFYWNHHGVTTANTAWEGKLAKELAKASEAARADEQAKQRGVNDALRQQNEKLAAVNGRLGRDLDRLRNRPERPADVPETPRPSCEGANGPELARVYAEFLTRFAARAAEQDAALEACYRVIDVMQTGQATPGETSVLTKK